MLFLESFDLARASRPFFQLSDPVSFENQLKSKGNSMIGWIFGLLSTNRGANRDLNRQTLRSALADRADVHETIAIGLCIQVS